MNILYSILTYDSQDSDDHGWYDKRRDSVPVLPARAVDLVNDMLASAGDSGTDRKKLACIICNESLGTCFGPDILAKDPSNTYADVGRPADAPVDAADTYCAYGLTESAKSLRRLDKWLDQDIRERLVVPTWFEYMAAAALQLLRICTE